MHIQAYPEIYDQGVICSTVYSIPNMKYFIYINVHSLQ